MLKVATPSLQAEQILASDYEPGKHYLKDAWPGALPFYLIQASPLWYKVFNISLTVQNIMSPSSCTIRRPEIKDKDQWQPLWRDYLKFYRSDLNDEATELLWQRIHDCQHSINCLVAEDSATGKLIGFVHYLPHPTTWNAKMYCYLEDLFVSPSLRGGGVGAELIKAVTDEARKQNWSDVYWHTEENNNRARGLYDKITGGTDGFVCYRIEPSE